jgi:anti-sigma regulatory factor (Ser/Thr protein kinase)
VVTDAAPGNNEVAQLARAFDDMRGKAVHLAGEQAELRLQVSEMFMTLSRRSQSLVESQLTVIDRLEADEQDPERLDELFRVDHLATRLRRNGENLQVLAGGQPVRHDHGPMSAVELLRAATSEVKDYRRIVLGNAPYCSVRAPAGEDVVHILAELLDNATRYSNPADKVLLTADRGADGGLLFEVVDTGLGMSMEDIEAANNRFAVGDVVSAETTRRMGLFVVGRLAALHGVTVRLRRTAIGTASPGITASVHVPGDLVVTDRSDGAGWPIQLTPAPRTNGHAALDDTAVRSGDLPLDWPTPIFDRMASRWFDQNGSENHDWSPPEVDEARKVAETATVPARAARQGRSGLPVRVPGAQLAPGAVQSREPATPDVPALDGFRRDPGAIRDNLSRHYTGMRAARRRTTNDDAPTES